MTKEWHWNTDFTFRDENGSPLTLAYLNALEHKAELATELGERLAVKVVDQNKRVVWGGDYDSISTEELHGLLIPWLLRLREAEVQG